MSKDTVKTSGATRNFGTGAHRDAAAGKGRCDLLPLDIAGVLMSDKVLILADKFIGTKDSKYLIEMLIESLHTVKEFNGSMETLLLEVSHLYEAGAAIYGQNNWRLGIPVQVFFDSAIRHYLKARRGDTDEPHHRGFAWNLLCAAWTVQNIPNSADTLGKVEHADSKPVYAGSDTSKKESELKAKEVRLPKVGGGIICTITDPKRKVTGGKTYVVVDVMHAGEVRVKVDDDEVWLTVDEWTTF
jgi:hypothetical protein